MATYARASADADSAGRLASRAVSSSHDGIGVDEGATAEVRAGAALEADNVGEVTGNSQLSSDDLGGLELRQRVTQGEVGQRQGGEGELHEHLEELRLGDLERPEKKAEERWLE